MTVRRQREGGPSGSTRDQMDLVLSGRCPYKREQFALGAHG
jgi:hypothetical protein